MKSKKTKRKPRADIGGSLTVEAVFAFPLMFFMCMSLLYVMQSYYLFGTTQKYLNEEAKGQSRHALAEGHKEDDVEECKLIVVEKYHDINLPIAVLAFPKLHMAQASITYPFTGRTIVPQSDDAEKEYVYVTPYGEVYHTTQDCAYLQPSVQTVAYQDVAELRNDSGAIYYACERCIKGRKIQQTEVVYIATYGNRYHVDKGCPGLKRTISKVLLEDTGDKRACKKCR